ncbi:MAG: 50S ribosomal protein L15 [Candidatus Shapirobacteria bacterium]|jgi:large subunit ribosomal protein L15
MEIRNNLTKTIDKSLKRRGRGIGSGVGGHTTGRGAKGDKSRGQTKITFDGSKIKKGWIKRLPFLRGKHRTNRMSQYSLITLEQIDKWFKTGETVDATSISKKAKISQRKLGASIKVLSRGKLTKTLTFKGLKFSEKALAQVTSSGGKID